MKKNIYTQTVSKIKVPDELLNSALENIRNADNVSDKIINISKPKTKSKIFKLTGSVAAVLAVVIAFGAVYFPGTAHNSSFVLKANAAELTSETYINIGNLEQTSKGAGFSVNEGIIEINNMSGQFNLDFQCIGDNIETITYTTCFDCGCFVVNTDDVGFIEYSASDKSYGYSGTGYSVLAKSCVFDYDNQPASRWEAPVPEDGIDGSVPLNVVFDVTDTEHKYTANINDFGDYSDGYNMFGDYNEGQDAVDKYIDSILADYLNTNAENFKIDVTATFTDGTTETQTLQFICENDGNDIYLNAKIA